MGTEAGSMETDMETEMAMSMETELAMETEMAMETAEATIMETDFLKADTDALMGTAEDTDAEEASITAHMVAEEVIIETEVAVTAVVVVSFAI